MPPPVRCYECGKVIKFERYLRLIRGTPGHNPIDEREALDQMGYVRYCCRQLFITCVPDDTHSRYDVPKSDVYISRAAQMAEQIAAGTLELPPREVSSR